MNERSTHRDVLFSLAILIIVALLFSSCMSGNQVMYESQFRSELSFSSWDVNGDDNISEDEFYNGILKTLDLDNNSQIDKEEWAKADYFFSTYASNDYGKFKKWDSNKNDLLDDEEFKSCFSKSNLYTKWDKNSDKMLNKSEFFAGIFDTWDINQDATLSHYEIDNWQQAAL